MLDKAKARDEDEILFIELLYPIDKSKVTVEVDTEDRTVKIMEE